MGYRLGEAVLGSPQKPGHHRDLHNISRAIKELFSKHGAEWVRSHIGRKYLVNRLDAQVCRTWRSQSMGWRDLNTVKYYLDEVTGVSATTKSAMRFTLAGEGWRRSPDC